MAQANTWLQRESPRGRDVSSMSKRLWRLDWSAELPWHFDDARVEMGTPDEAQRFMRDHYASIFGGAELEGRFLASPMTEAKQRFFAEMDFFVFHVGTEVAGVFMAHPTDWSTYYIRSTAILPKFRDRRLMSRVFDKLTEPLSAAGVERVEAEVSPMNEPIVRVLSSHGYIVTGSTSSERWGLTLRYTKFLAEDARATFTRQFTAMRFAKRRPTGVINSERSLP